MMDKIKKIAIKTNLITADLTHQTHHPWAANQHQKLASYE